MSAVRILWPLMAACLALLMQGAAHGQQGLSLMVNSGFEAGTDASPSAWSRGLAPSGHEVGQTLTRTRDKAHSGSWSLKFDTGPVLGKDVILVSNGSISEAATKLRGQTLHLSGFVYLEPRTAQRPLRMRLRTFGPGPDGANTFLGDVLETTAVGVPGKWTEFRASGVVPDKAIARMDLHCSLSADRVRVAQYLDDVTLAVPLAAPLTIRPMRTVLWSDEPVVPVSVAAGRGVRANADLSIRMLDADGRNVADWQRKLQAGPLGLPMPAAGVREGHYTLQAEVTGSDGARAPRAEASLEVLDSPWEGAPGSVTPPRGARPLKVDSDFDAMGTVAPTSAADAAAAEAEPVSEDVPLDAWQDRGYVPFSRHPLDLPSRLGRPWPGDIGALRLLASPGEYEAGTLAVWALRAQSEVMVSVSDLAGDAGAIASDCIDVRVVRYLAGLPSFLEKRSSVRIPSGQTQTFWLTVHVPPEATPGFYRGTVTVTPTGGTRTEADLLLRVLPLDLPAPSKGYGFWWAMDGRWKGYYSDDRRAALEQIRKQFVLLREHGCNTVSYPGLPKMTSAKDGAVRYDFAQDHWGHRPFSFADFVRLGKDTGLLTREHAFQYVGAEGLHSEWVARHHGFDRSSRDLGIFYRAACRRIDEWVTEQGLTAAFACVDEIGNSAEKRELALRFYKEAEGAGVLTSVTDNSMSVGVHLMGRPEFDEIITMRLYDYITPEVIANARASRDHLWLYNMASGGWFPKRDRFIYGLFTERCSAEGCAQWAFQWPQGDRGPYGQAAAGESPGWHYALPAPDGPLPTLALAAVREGIDDARYLACLEKRAPGSPEASLEDIEPITARVAAYVDALDGRGFDARRWRMARAAIAASR